MEQDQDVPSAENYSAALAELSEAMAEVRRAEAELAATEQADEQLIGPGLNPKRRAFVREFVLDRNATQAAIRAGYSKHSAISIGSFLLTIVEVRAAIDKLEAERAAAVGITQESVLHEMKCLAMARLEHFIIDDEGQVKPAPHAPEGVMAAIKSIKRKVKVHYDKHGNVDSKDYDVEVQLWDKPTPLKLMGKHVGLFPDKVELTGKDGKPIEVTEVRSVIVDPKGDS